MRLFIEQPLASPGSAKNNKKKWSQILKLLLIKGVKLPHKKSLFLGKFCLTEQNFFGIGATIYIGREILCLPYVGFLATKLKKSNDYTEYTVPSK